MGIKTHKLRLPDGKLKSFKAITSPSLKTQKERDAATKAAVEKAHANQARQFNDPPKEDPPKS